MIHRHKNKLSSYTRLARAAMVGLFMPLLHLGCTTHSLQESGDGLEVSKIHVDRSSKRMDGSTEMITRCSGFILSELDVRNFMENAARFAEPEPDKYYRILPCSATGTVVVNHRKYSWVIRAGGIGEIFSGNERLVLICGKKCCEKTPGVC